MIASGRGVVRCGLFAGLLLVAACHGERTDSSAAPAALSTAERPAATTANLRAWVDPETGELGVPPAATLPQRGAAAGDGAELAVVPGVTSAGGVMVDLRGHFSYRVRVSASPEGRISNHCDSRESVGVRD